jgi:hypothetical protein
MLCVAKTGSCLESAGYGLERSVGPNGTIDEAGASHARIPVLSPGSTPRVRRSRSAPEVLALRQQVAVLKRQQPRPTLTRLHPFFWTTLRHLWPRWSDVLLIMKPETVVQWHRAGFRLYRRWRSRPRGRPPRVSEEIRTLIRRLAAKNADCGGRPRIHGELLRLGFDVSERSVARYLRRVPRRGDPASRTPAGTSCNPKGIQSRSSFSNSLNAFTHR